MKKLHLTLLLLASAALASCSDKDDVTNPAEGLAGQYEGYTTASCAYFPNQVATDQTVTVSSSATLGKINISFESSTWGTITIDDATVAQSGSEKTFYGEGKSLMGHAGGEAKEYVCTASGKFTGGELQASFSIPAVMGGLTIVKSVNFCNVNGVGIRKR